MATKKEYNPISYINSTNPGIYRSAYSQRLSEGIRDLANARNAIQNFKYDPLKDASYQALAQVYGARGNKAAQDTLGDAASLNGGQQTSYAVSAAQQARNQYNQELAALVPDLSAQAYNRLTTNYGLLQDSYNLWNDLDTKAYGRYRDRVADYQWGKGYDTDVYQYRAQMAAQGIDPNNIIASAYALADGGGSGGSGGGSGGGGGGGRSYGGGGSSRSSSGDSGLPITEEEFNSLRNGNTNKQGPKRNAPQAIRYAANRAVNQTKKKK